MLQFSMLLRNMFYAPICVHMWCLLHTQHIRTVIHDSGLHTFYTKQHVRREKFRYEAVVWECNRARCSYARYLIATFKLLWQMYFFFQIFLNTKIKSVYSIIFIIISFNKGNIWMEVCRRLYALSNKFAAAQKGNCLFETESVRLTWCSVKDNKLW